MDIKIIVANPTTEALETISRQSVRCTNVSAETSNIGEFYNREFLRGPRAAIYGFMTGTDKLYRDDCVKTVVEKFDNDHDCHAVYSDKLLEKDGLLVPQIYPQFELGMQLLFNPILFVRGSIDKPIFRPDLRYLLSFDAVTKIGQVAHVIHVPQFLVSSKFSSNDIKEEIERYVRQSD